MSEKKNMKGQLGHINFDGGYDPNTTENIDLIERRTKHFAGSFLFYHNPIHVVRGEGAYLFDDKGRRYLDFYNNVQSMGHANPEVAEAIAKQSGILTTHTRYLSEPIITLAERLAATLPDPLDVCLFVCTGTEACELAMRIARVVTKNSGVIVMENAYHGNSKLVGEMSTATYPPALRPAHIQAVEPPNTYRGSYRKGETKDNNLGKLFADKLDHAIDTLDGNGQSVAGFVCDCIFDSQGTLSAPDDYFKHAYKKVRDAGGLCIADEVQAGVFRTGKTWGFEHFDVIPDIVFTGKPLGGGFPIAAVFTTREIADKWAEDDVYFNTFGGNPVAAKAALSVFDFAEKHNMSEHVRSVGEHLVKRLKNLARKHDVIGDISGRGLFIGVELVKDRKSKDPATELARKIPDAMKDKGVLIGLTGQFGNRLKFRPPLIVTKADVDFAVNALDEVLAALSS